jgi:hypothetical protein
MGFLTKKRFLYIVGFIVLIVIIANINNKDSKPIAAQTTEVTETPSTAVTKLSKEAVSSNVKIAVESFDSKDKVGDNEINTEKAQGVFKVIKVTLTNNQKDAITINANAFTLIDDQNRQFSYSSDAQIALETSSGEMDSFFLKKLNPGLSATGLVVFDVPKDAKGFVLEARGGMAGKKVQLNVQ